MNQLPQQSLYGENPRLEVQPFIPRGVKTVLDVGCGEGGFGGTLRTALGSDAYIVGVDAVAENVASARQRKGYDEVLHGYFPEVLSGAGTEYDLITFLDVLEHMSDPWATLSVAHSLLSRGGSVVAAVPNVQTWTLLRDLYRGRWDYTDWGILDRTHVRFFTKATTVEMFEDAGFIVAQCQGVNSQKAPVRPIRALFNRRLIRDMKWIPYILPDSQWLQFVVVATKPV